MSIILLKASQRGFADHGWLKQHIHLALQIITTMKKFSLENCAY
jgi:hypothetical protein